MEEEIIDKDFAGTDFKDITKGDEE